MNNENKKLRAVVVGLRMGGSHARVLAALTEYELVGICDLDEEVMTSLASETGNPLKYKDYQLMLKETNPDVVVIATPNKLHVKMTRQAVEAGVKGIYCEKPMAVNMGDAREMVQLCKKNNIALAVGHQRRMSAPYQKMKKLIDDGAIGDIELIRGTCAGDVLSDGTHTIDSILYLLDDIKVEWILGQIFRKESSKEEKYVDDWSVFTGWRYGHLIESGAMATFELVNGVRVELLTGDIRMPGRLYQDIEVFGKKGRLWRPGDQGEPGLLLDDGRAGGYQPVSVNEFTKDEKQHVFKEFAKMVEEDIYYPLNGDNALRGFEINMAIYESARLRDIIELPLKQDRYPLEIMVENNEL